MLSKNTDTCFLQRNYIPRSFHVPIQVSCSCSSEAHTSSHLTRTVTFTTSRDTALRQQRLEKRCAFSLNCANEAPSLRMMRGPIYVRDHARRFVFGDISTPLIDCLQWRADKFDHVCTFAQNIIVGILCI